MVEVEHPQKLDPHLKFPPNQMNLNQPIPILDMIDTRTNQSVRDTVHMLQGFFPRKMRSLESINDRSIS